MQNQATQEIKVQFEEVPNPNIMEAHVNFDTRLHAPLGLILESVKGIDGDMF